MQEFYVELNVDVQVAKTVKILLKDQKIKQHKSNQHSYRKKNINEIFI